VLKTSGSPYRSIASSSASTQNAVSRVADRRHDRTLRLYQSMIAVRRDGSLFFHRLENTRGMMYIYKVRGARQARKHQVTALWGKNAGIAYIYIIDGGL
jgi:glycosidase